MTSSGLLKRLGQMLTEDLDLAEDVRVERECCASGTQRARDCERGDEARMVGELRSVQTSCKGKTGVIAEFFDGTDTVMLKWIGRCRIPGIESGRRVTVRGRVATADGMKVIYNPYYELHSRTEDD
ncbi:MAG: OB-fold nucleic acid binding domain-containing protein [Gordonia sp. (in: high G+C Gram-positive bacteria)]|uniref:OB-fold nucleic acid binding domain-containing protein n=1 Tax=Gordonia sp. (in: high G+C Gram-positive bacteria) TaxID=84139 RepID=UPI003BB7DC79